MRYDINPYKHLCRQAHIAPKVYRIVRYIANPSGFISLQSVNALYYNRLCPDTPHSSFLTPHFF